MGWFAVTLRSVGTVLGAAWPFLKQRFAERAAGDAPGDVPASVSDDLMDASLRRLGELKPDDPLWKRSLVGLEGALVRPDLFNMPSVREWLSRPQVRSGIKRSAETAIARGTLPQDLINRLADDYADSTGDDRRFADQAIRIAVAFLQTSVQAFARDPGTAAIVQATTSELGRKIESGFADAARDRALADNPFISEHFTQDGRDELNRILRRRATQGAKTAEELRSLIRDFEPGGRFAAAAPPLQQDATFWLARMEAADGDGATAAGRFLTLEQLGYAVPPAAWALVDLAKGDAPAALRRVRDLTDAESQTATFHTLMKSQGKAAALQYVDDLGELTPRSFTAIGWNNVCVLLQEEGRIADSAALLERLPEAVLCQCTSLYYMYAVSQLLPMLPIDRHSALRSSGFYAVTEPVLDNPQSSVARARALEAAELARQCATDARDALIIEQCVKGIHCLRLHDPRTRDEEIASIQEAMKDGEAAIHLIGVARACSVDFDPQPLERHLERAQRMGGLSEPQLRAKLKLLAAPNRSADLVRFLDESWDSLLPDHSVEALVIMKVQALAITEDFDGATAFLDAHANRVEAPTLSRLQLMLQDARGEDPSDAAVQLFHQSDSIVDLHNLVRVLVGRNRWKRLKPYAEQLFQREPNYDNAVLQLNCLRRTRASAKEISAFLERTIDLVEQRAEIRSARAWALFGVGKHLEAKRVNDELLVERDATNDLALDVNIAIRTGDWERFAAIGARGWERRAQLDGRMLLTLARLVGFSDPAQSLILAQEAVARESDDPAILVGANAIAIAARRDDLAMPWVHKAAELSKDDGPVSVFSYGEMVEFMKSNAESWRKKNEMYRTGQVPLHVAGSLFNVPFSQLLIAQPRQNAREVDPRRRHPVPIRSGQRAAAGGHEYPRVALDITALFVLSELGKLEAVLDSLDEVFVSPRVMDVLLEDRGRVAFHQPSRIAQVKPLNAWVTSGRLKVIDAKASSELTDEVGDEAAVLLAEAQTHAGMFIHPGSLFKVASYMDKEAALGELQARFADPVDVVNALRVEGLITQAEGDDAMTLLQRIGMAARQPVQPSVPLYLDGLAVQYLQQAKLLQPLLNSRHVVYVHKSTVDEWQALLATEPMTDELIQALDALRRTVRAGLMSGKVKFLAESRRRSELNATTMLPMVDLLDDIAGVDAVVLDDRMLGSNLSLTDAMGKTVPVLSSLDMLGMLVRKGAMTEASQRESLHLLRARCYFCIPIDPDEVSYYLGRASVENGKLQETAQLRVIRQYLARLNATDVLCTATDLSYQDSLWRASSVVIGMLWMDTATSVVDAEAKSDWVVANLLPNPELVMRFTQGEADRIDEVVASQLNVSLMPFGGDAARRKAYARWLERARLFTLLPANSRVLDLAAGQAAELLIRRASEIADEVRSRSSADPTE